MLKNPGSEIAFWSILFILAGTLVSYTAFADGKTGLGLLFAMLPVGCALIWLDVRPAKWFSPPIQSTFGCACTASDSRGQTGSSYPCLGANPTM